jgi:hypothetical protein
LRILSGRFSGSQEYPRGSAEALPDVTFGQGERRVAHEAADFAAAAEVEDLRSVGR